MTRPVRNTDKRIPQHVRKLFAVVQKEIDEFGMIRRQSPEGSIKAVSTKFDPNEPMLVSGIANLAKMDRWDELIPPTAWEKHMGNYLKNPIILRDHNHGMPVGNCKVKIEDDGLHYDAVIGDPKKAILTAVQLDTRSLIAQDILRTNSVGFIPHVMEWDEDEEVLKYIEVELLEISIVAVPMQQDSVITSVKSWRKQMGKKSAEDDKDDNNSNEPKLSEIKSLLEENNKMTKGCHDNIEKMLGESAKSIEALSTENKKVKAELEASTKKIAELEKNVGEILDQIEKSGVVLTAPAA